MILIALSLMILALLTAWLRSRERMSVAPIPQAG